MNEKEIRSLSKFLSLHLRHRPERIGLVLQSGGWVPAEMLLRACGARHRPITREQLDEVVAGNDKQRFSFDETGTLIRANQGHGVPVDLELPGVAPPVVLFTAPAAAP